MIKNIFPSLDVELDNSAIKIYNDTELLFESNSEITTVSNKLLSNAHAYRQVLTTLQIMYDAPKHYNLLERSRVGGAKKYLTNAYVRAEKEFLLDITNETLNIDYSEISPLVPKLVYNFSATKGLLSVFEENRCRSNGAKIVLGPDGGSYLINGFNYRPINISSDSLDQLIHLFSSGVEPADILGEQGDVETVAHRLETFSTSGYLEILEKALSHNNIADYVVETITGLKEKGLFVAYSRIGDNHVVYFSQLDEKIGSAIFAREQKGKVKTKFLEGLNMSYFHNVSNFAVLKNVFEKDTKPEKLMSKKSLNMKGNPGKIAENYMRSVHDEIRWLTAEGEPLSELDTIDPSESTYESYIDHNPKLLNRLVRIALQEFPNLSN